VEGALGGVPVVRPPPPPPAHGGQGGYIIDGEPHGLGISGPIEK
jgi:hypothetical protein